MQVFKVPGTGLEVIQNIDRYFIRNPKTGRQLFAERVQDPLTGKRFYRTDLIEQAKAALQVMTIPRTVASKVEQPKKKAELQNNIVAVSEENQVSFFFEKGYTLAEVISVINNEGYYDLDEFRFIDLVTKQDLRITLNIEVE